MRGITETTTTHCHSHIHISVAFQAGNGGPITQSDRRAMTSEVSSCGTNKSSSGPEGRAMGVMWNSAGDGGGETTGAGGLLVLYHGTYSPGYPPTSLPMSRSQAHSAWNHSSWISSTWRLHTLRAFLRRSRSFFWARFLL